MEHKIDFVLAPALDMLDARLAAGEAGTHDFAFIDADKSNYDHYYERCLALVCSGGLIALDNMLWGGAVTRPGTDADIATLQALNAKLQRDRRIAVYLYLGLLRAADEPASLGSGELPACDVGELASGGKSIEALPSRHISLVRRSVHDLTVVGATTMTESVNGNLRRQRDVRTPVDTVMYAASLVRRTSWPCVVRPLRITITSS